MAYTLDVSLALGLSNTGLTLEAQVVDTTGSPVGAPITTGFTEIGEGNYLFHTTAMPDGHRGGITFQVSPGGTIKAFVAINPEEVENSDIKTSTVAAAVWSYVSRTLTQLISAVSPPPVVEGTVVTITRGDTLRLQFSNLGSLVGRSKLWFTLKTHDYDVDTAALIQIEETAGLLRFNGAAATSGLGSLTVTDENAGNVTVVLDPSLSAQLVAIAGRYYDFQMLTANGVSTITSGRANIIADITRATA